MPVRLVTGFEQGSIAGWATGAAGNKFADTINSTPTIVSTNPRTGSYCLEVSAAAASESVLWDTNTLTASQNRLVAGFGIYFPTSLPSSSVVLAQMNTAAGIHVLFEFNSATSKVAAGWEGGTITDGPTVTTNTWYYVELYANLSANPNTLDWQVDTVAQSQVTQAQAATTVASFRLGTSNSETFTARYDDLIVVTDTANLTFPIGKHKVQVLVPDTGGSLDVGTITTAEWNTFAGTTPTLSAWDATVALAAIDEIPVGLGASADGLCRITGTDTDYVGIPFTSYTIGGGESIAGLRMLACCWAASGTACFHSFDAYNGTTSEQLLASSDVATDNSSTAPAWVCKMLPTLANYDTQTELDALQIRFGSTDTTPDAGIHAVYVEVAVKEGAGMVDKTLADAGAAGDALAVAAAQPASDAGAAAQALVVGVAPTDAGSSTQTLGVAPILAQPAAGAEALAVAAAQPLADAGVGADALVVAAAVPLAQPASAADALAVTVPVLAADQGAGADSLTLAAAVPLADAGAAADSLSVDVGSVAKTLVETGAGAEALVVAAALVLGQAAATADAVSVDMGAVAKTLSDSGAASGGYSDGYGTFLPPEQLAIAAAVPLAQPGTGADSLSVDQGTVAKALADVGAGSEALTVAAAQPLAETGSGADSLTVDVGSVPKTLADSGAASDQTAITAQTPLADGTQTIAEALTLTAQIVLADAAAGVESVSIAQGVPKTLAEVGTAAESLPTAAQVPAGDQGAATDQLPTAAALPLPQPGSAADSVTADQSVAKTLTDSGSAADSATRTIAQAVTLAEAGTGSERLPTAAQQVLAEAAAAVDSVPLAAAFALLDTATATERLLAGAVVWAIATATIHPAATGAATIQAAATGTAAAAAFAVGDATIR